MRHGLNWLLRGKGPAASPIAQHVAFVRTRPEEENRPDIQIHFVPTGYEFGPDGIKLPGAPRRHSAGQRSAARRAGAGSRSAHPTPNEPPRIFSNLLGDEDDVRRMVDGCKISRAIFESKAFKPHFEELYLPAPGDRSDEALESLHPAIHAAGLSSDQHL